MNRRRRNERARALTPPPLVLIMASTGLLTIAGCASADEIPGEQIVQPAPAPDSWTPTAIGGVTLALPSEFESGNPVNPGEGVIRHPFRSAVDENGAGGGINVDVAKKPQRSADEEAYALIAELEATQPVEDTLQETVNWPGVDAATYIRWERDVDYDDGTVLTFKHEGLFVDLPDGTQVVVLTGGPRDLYDELGLASVIPSIEAGA